MTYHALGLMSGSSLDGLDVALCRFETERKGGRFAISDWEIIAAETFPFSDFWKKRLRHLPTGSAFELADAHAAFGAYMGHFVNQFFVSQNLDAPQIDLVASHGHTVFHEPPAPPSPPKRGGVHPAEKAGPTFLADPNSPPFGGAGGGFTTQIGDGAALAAATRCTVVADFRTADVALGGQGAPLAPMADKLLFPGHDFYLNLGGIANLTCDVNGRFVAFDVTGANQILNAVAQRFFQKNYDENGDLARSGKLDIPFLEKINGLPFFDLPYPKSLSNQWVQKNLVEPTLTAEVPPADLLHTVCHHVAEQLAKSISQVIENEGIEKDKFRLFATGGGVYNRFLMKCISEKNPNVEVVIPLPKIVEFKEAALMALLGVMRLEEVPNCMSSVTGARRDAIGGAVYLPSL